MMNLVTARYHNDYDGIDDETILKFMTISKALGKIGKGENYSVVSLLDSDDFKSLSEDNKAQVFRNSGRNGTCVHKVSSCDIPTYIQQMLPYMPLHKFQSCSLPTGLTWIESEEWMRDMLVKHKVRWNSDSNAIDNESILLKTRDTVDDTKAQIDEDVMLQNDEDVMLQNDEDAMLQNDEDVMLQNDEDLKLKNSSVIDEDIIRKLRNLAFTMLAAELFYICCCVNAIHCCEYLLNIAPNLVGIKAGPNDTGALSTAVMHDCSDVIYLLQEHQAPIGNIAQAMYFIFMESKNTRSFKFITNAFACTDKKDDVKDFRDLHGNTLLHVIFNVKTNWLMRYSYSSDTDRVMRESDEMDEDFDSCFQMLLDCGVDPRVMNDNSETVLDTLIEFYSTDIVVDRNRIARKEIFLRCLERILPYLGVKLPSDSLVNVCQITELHLKDEQNFVKHFRDLHGNTLLHVLFNVNTNWLMRDTDRVMRKSDKMDEGFYSCFQMLLDCGVDPRVMNDNSETVLDTVIEFYSMDMYWDRNRIARKEIFLRCLERILPYLGVKLPSDFLCELETVHGIVNVFRIAELLLKDEHNFVFVIRSMQSHNVFLKCKPSDCQLCRPALTLFYQAMCKGIDMHSIPGEPMAEGFLNRRKNKDYVGFLMACSHRRNTHDVYVYGSGSKTPMSRLESLECCHWALLEFLVHSGHDVFSHIDVRDTDPRYGDALVSPVHVLKTFLTALTRSWLRLKSESHLVKIRSIMSMLNMYSPSMIPQLLAYLPGNADNNEKLMLETIANMHEEFDPVRPLQLLCRLTIRGNVTWKDVEKLSLPGKLKQYLRIGEIHTNHVIHQIIDDETKVENNKEVEDIEEK